jgi:pimeloyl-ACP methyl ester carboxylesterase
VEVDLSGVPAVVLPGTGSDDDYVTRAFGAPLRQAGAVLIAAPPQPGRLIGGYLTAMDSAALDGPIAVGGVSIGAAVATAWALVHPGRTVAVLAALPPWTGPPGTAPGAVAARYSAQQLRSDGLAAATRRLYASSPRWLADELARSWSAQWPSLPDAMEEAANYVAPTDDQLAQLAVPLGIAAAVDDPVHPWQVAAEWVKAAPRAALRLVTLDQFGADPAELGAACLTALRAI